MAKFYDVNPSLTKDIDLNQVGQKGKENEKNEQNVQFRPMTAVNEETKSGRNEENKPFQRA